MSQPDGNVSYTAEAGISTTALAPTTYYATSADAQKQNVTIGFDAVAGRYTVTWNGRVTSMSGLDIESTDEKDTVYHRQTATTDDWLTVQHNPYTINQTARRDVNLAFAQHNDRSGSGLALDIAFFAYGNPSAATQVPHTGQASFDVDGIGMVTAPGKQPLAFQIEGGMSFDFGASQFNALLPITGFPLKGLQGGGGYGGGYQIVAGGQLTANSSRFTGTFALAGFIAGVSGTLSGGFYGPTAGEAGASFFGVAPDGSTTSGAFTALRNPTSLPKPSNLITVLPGNFFYANGLPGGSFAYLENNTYRFAPGQSDLPVVTFGAANQTASSNPNFTAYAKNENGRDVTIKMYKVGPANTELALTYATFGDYWTAGQSPTQGPVRDFFVYGVATNNTVIFTRTGSARYDGVIYGEASNKALNGTYDISGTSRFDVNFDSDTVSGLLSLQAAALNGSPALALPDTGFSGPMQNWGVSYQEATYDSANVSGKVLWNLYGPTGNELAAVFSMNRTDNGIAGQTIVTGATVGKEK